MTILITGTGTRTAVSFAGDPDRAPRLAWREGTPPPETVAPTVSLDPGTEINFAPPRSPPTLLACVLATAALFAARFVHLMYIKNL